jgi:hypothetical protein
VTARRCRLGPRWRCSLLSSGPAALAWRLQCTAAPMLRWMLNTAGGIHRVAGATLVSEPVDRRLPAPRCRSVAWRWCLTALVSAGHADAKALAVMLATAAATTPSRADADGYPGKVLIFAGATAATKLLAPVLRELAGLWPALWPARFCLVGDWLRTEPAAYCRAAPWRRAHGRFSHSHHSSAVPLLLGERSGSVRHRHRARPDRAQDRPRGSAISRLTTVRCRFDRGHPILAAVQLRVRSRQQSGGLPETSGTRAL